MRIEPFGFAPSRQGIVQTASIQPADTWVVDISQPWDALLASMHPKTRYNYRVAHRDGVRIQMATSPSDSGFEKTVRDFIAMLSFTATRHTFRLHPKDYYREMITFFMQNNDRGETGVSLRLYTAYTSTTPIAAIMVLYFGKTATFLHGGSDYQYRDFMAPYALHIQAMKDAADLGLHSYDMGGIAHSDDSHDPWQGMTRFKKGFSGNQLHYPGTFDIVFRRFRYSAYSAMRNIRTRLRSSMDRT